MSAARKDRLVLGLDIGTTSIGWALVQENGTGGEIVRAGVRLFSTPGTTNVADLERGREAPAGQERRLARQLRRQHRRRAQRKRRLWNALVKAGIFPAGIPKAERSDYLRSLDREAAAHLASRGLAIDHGKLPYQLRAFALDHSLPKPLLGRAFMHLGMRRGFLSNRRAARADKQESEFLTAISDLERRIVESGCRTLGEFLAGLDSREERIRGRWTARRMYQSEFDCIVHAQHEQGLVLDDKSLRRIHSAIFYQRPLRSVRKFVGRCELESTNGKGPRRCAMADPLAQEFRYLQKANDLRVISPDQSSRKLTSEEREKVLQALAESTDVKFTQLRRLLDPERRVSFNLEAGGEKSLPGARTLTRLRAACPEWWNSAPPQARSELVRMVLSVDDDAVLERHLVEKLRLTSDDAVAVTRATIEPGYVAFSRRALLKLLPLMREGDSFATAKKQVYGEQSRTEPLQYLPPVSLALPLLRNPVVARALSELRKVVNGLIAEGFRPDVIRVELARDLKQNRDKRQRTWQRNRVRQRERERAEVELLRNGITPTRRQIEKFLLWEESNRACPYTGRVISFNALFGDAPEFDVEHIIPFSRSLDDSFVNKTLCEIRENRNTKRGNTPVEAYGGNADIFGRIIDRVGSFSGDVARAKLERFLLAEVPSDIAERHLNDTRFAATCAIRYLAGLFGSQVDEAGRQRVFATSGGLTWLLRSMWDLNRILGESDMKSRDDHRHHAVDAAVVAMTSPARVRSLQTAAERLGPEGARRLEFPPPWPAFRDQLATAVQGVLVSERVDRRVAGRLHKETHYGRANDGTVRVRCALDQLTPTQVEQIVDQRVKEIVKSALDGKGDPKVVFKTSVPQMPNRNGAPVPIKSVRVLQRVKPEAIGTGANRQLVATDENHHAAFYGLKKADGSLEAIKWKVVSRFEAAQRQADGMPIVDRSADGDFEFLFSLSKGEVLAFGDAGSRMLLSAIFISDGDFEFRELHDGRNSAARKRDRRRFTSGRSFMAFKSIQKVRITPTGRLVVAND